MTPEELLFKEAREALDKGEDAQARELFARLLKLNPSHPDYWLWMSTVVETEKERGYCLKEVLKLDPANLYAIRGLRLMGEEYQDPEPPLTISQLQVKWKNSLDAAPQKKDTSVKLDRRKIVTLILGVAVIAILITVSIVSTRSKQNSPASSIMRWSLTPSATITVPLKEATSTPDLLGPLPIVLENTLTLTPIYAATPHNLTEAYTAAIKAFKDQEWSTAIDYFNQVLAVEPDSADIQYLIGECYRFQEKYDESSAAYNETIAINPDYAPGWLGKGRIYLLSNPPKLNEASAAFEKAVELDPNLSESLLELANISLSQGNAHAALEWLNRLPSSASSSAPFEYARAQAWLLLGKTDTALQSVQKANLLDRSYLPVYKLWGQILQQNGQYAESIPYLLTYQTNSTEDSTVDLLLAVAYANTNEIEKALSAVNTALELDEKNEAAYITRGDIYLLMNETKLAENDYDTALKINYYSSAAAIGKGRVQLLATYAGSAYSYFQRAEEYADTDSEKATALYWRAAALIALEEYQAAARDFESFLALPANIVPASLRATALMEYQGIITATPTLTKTGTTTMPTIKNTQTPAAAQTIRPDSTPTK